MIAPVTILQTFTLNISKRSSTAPQRLSAVSAALSFDPDAMEDDDDDDEEEDEENEQEVRKSCLYYFASADGGKLEYMVQLVQSALLWKWMIAQVRKWSPQSAPDR